THATARLGAGSPWLVVGAVPVSPAPVEFVAAGTAARFVAGLARRTPTWRIARAERQVQRVRRALARLAWRVLRRRRTARPVGTAPVRTCGAALPPRPSRTSRRTTSGAGPSLRAGAASAAAGSLPPAARVAHRSLSA
ncbi:hypothetical protein, partial [Nonomuraea sp. NPDC003201]